MMRIYRARLTRFAISFMCSILGALICGSAWAQATGDYRSVASGNWNATATWERFNGTTWVPAVATPTSADGVITVRSPNTVTVTAAVTVDQVVVDAGGQITQNAITVTIANSAVAGTDLIVNGTYRNAGTMTINASATVAFGAGGKYQHNFTTTPGTIPNATWDLASTCEIVGYTMNNNAPGNIGQSFGNFTWNCPGQTSNLSLAGGLTTVGGDMTVTATNTGQLRLTGATALALTIAGNYSQAGGTLNFVTTNNNANVAVSVAGNFSVSGGTFNMSDANNSPGTLTVTGNFSHTAGTITEAANASGTIVFNKAGTQTYTSGGTVSNTIHFTVNNGSTLALGTNIVTGGGNFTLSSGAGLQIGSAGGIASSGATGNIQNTGTRSFSTGANYTYDGSAAQVTGTGLPATINSLTVNNAAGLALTNSSTASVSITFTSGNVTTGASALGLSAAGSVSRTSGHVVGNFSKGFGTGAATKSFEIGSSAAYTPATVAFANVTTGGSLTASATGAEHANISTSGIDPAKSVNRYWTLTNSGIAFSTYDATFEFVPGDVDGGADPNAFYVRKYNSPAWTAPVTGARTATSTQATGLTSFSDFAIGERTVHTITASAGANGSISPSGAVSVIDREDQSFTITADPCYQVADVLVDGVSVGAVSSYSFTSVTTNHTIAASFSPIVYTISASAGAGGSISPDGAVGVNCGADQSFTITPDACYSIADVLVDGVSIGAAGSYTFTNVSANHTIDASFSLDTYTITASAGAGGSISPSGAVAVNCGSDQTFTITPDVCYSIADVLVDGVSVGAVSSYTFTNVAANHTIDASFSLDSYTITATAGAGGSIAPSGAVSVGCGSDQTFTITPDPGYSIADVIVDGSSVGAVGSYTFTNVTANHTIDASFSLNSFTITATAGANGSISPSGAVSVAYGADQTFTIAADACYSIADVLVDGVSVGPAASYTFTNVTADHTIDASFAPTTYTITATAGAGGSISPSGAVSVGCGANQAFSIAPDPGYHILDVLVDGGSIGAQSSYTFTNVAANHTIDASFEINPPVPAITALSATQVKLGNDTDGTTKIRLEWPAVAPGSSVEVFRAGFGNYPEYDDGGTPGSAPSAPSYPPGSPWALTAVSDSGQTDEVAARDVFYYVAFVTDAYGTKSLVSNMTGGTLNYHLGDTHNGSTDCAGDNAVTTSDVSHLGANYGAVLTDGDARACLDVGPTINGSVNARPSTDDRLQFEDLILIGINYNSVGKTRERPAPAAADEIAIESPAKAAGRVGETIVARLMVSGTGKAQGVSIRLSWNPLAVEPMGVAAGELLEQIGGLALTPEPGIVDAVVLGSDESARITGSGTLALVTFRVLANLDAKIAVASIDARDAANAPVSMRTRLAVPTPEGPAVNAGPPLATALLPNRPNPFNPLTTVAFRLAEPDAVELSIYSADGRLVRTLAHGVLPAGQHDLVWDGRDERGTDVGSGRFFALLKTSKTTMTRSLTLLR